MDMTWFDEVEARIPKGKVRTRFAPSPTGYMHVGNLRTALYTWLIARHADGTFILRIEDTDQGRLVEGAVDVIYKTLAECGLDHDEGPDVGGPVAPYIQTERRPFYGRYAELLIERGHAYRCFCEKSESEEDSGEFDRGDDPCRALPREEAERRAAAGEPFVIRQRIPHEGTTTFHDEIFGDITVENSTLDDQVLMKRDGLPTYNFANVVDDHMMGITHVVRGSEYLSSAPKYNLLYQGFGWDVPADSPDYQAFIDAYLPALIGEFNRYGTSFAAVLDKDSVSLDECSFEGAALAVVGNEGNGLTEDTVKACTHKLYIPMSGKAESLNVSAAASIILWEMKK